MKRIVPIGEVTDIARRSIDPRKHPDTLFDLYSIPGFDNDKKPERRLGKEIGSNKWMLPEKGVLFSKLNPRINRVWVFDENDSALRIASTEFACLVPDERRLDSEYLGWRLRIPGIEKELSCAAVAATKSRARIKPESILDLQVSLPSIVEQRRIVGTLNRAAKIERLRRQAKERLREFLPALFVKMFGDPATNIQTSTQVPFHKAIRDTTGGHPKVKKRDYLPDGPIPVLDQGQEYIAGCTTKNNAYAGQLPVILFGDHTRIFKYVDFPFALGADGVKVLVPLKGFDARFLCHYFRNANLPSHGYSRHFKFLRKLSICKPPLEKQRRFAEIAKSAEEVFGRMRFSEQTTCSMNSALMSDLLGNTA